MKKQLIAAALLLSSPFAAAGLITSEGAVTALTNIAQVDIQGTAEFDFSGSFTPIPLTEYTSQGLTFHEGALTAILPGVTTPGTANGPQAYDWSTYFPMVGGGASSSGTQNNFAGVATFNIPVTTFGLTASSNGKQYLTVWDTSGLMLGQVNWDPSSGDSLRSTFVGVDTGGVEIGMLAYGNDDLWNGAAYGVGGSTIISDNWVWGGPVSVPEPSSVVLFGLGMLSLSAVRRRKTMKS